MSIIRLTTTIHCNIEVAFDLSRSIDLHIMSTKSTNEVAVAGVTSGLISLNESVTWEATHLGIRQQLTAKITIFERPFHFRDEMVKGAFDYFKHDHFFEAQSHTTIMTDVFEFTSPFGVVGKLFDRIFLTRYMTKFLVERNNTIKQIAESPDSYKFLHFDKNGVHGKQ
ncbi:MAG TPA: SRPBCC family protein [Chitinophagales bacterium]|nr:SRPBCC family protein [Chitinophagales bacterium]HMX03258.1 SRPBCC family protein [Chitinophagales bacterium]HNE46065.1 SRPBCC family protein [Chitinophagales bacterium]HNF68334.1 SRPBCC family protein [Chitinophagales bacterium]HNI53950.1 SRPBCC family protein [Chitinophagales bacterium]